ncbi:gamma-aminobutyric acid receptor-associated protein-like 2 [Lingula anatina]|uniref:Gamma-aminobutyric acid receptor-associated protein-like 2 n=1 Tax=Lingula anatina TaxID=7574 RepID=A0A1S3K3S6_LINAN|nr:gamma-aminobutyric acid receptor-associated protein-like 2 [Lingula anatina]|eukprot:XP_013417177.1 gamma-aminobutyric acid receptor-associated protein-like 2 [Lingula anatina]
MTSDDDVIGKCLHLVEGTNSCSDLRSYIELHYKMKFKFKEENTFDTRKCESAKIRSKYPDRIPVVVEKAPRSNIAEIDKRKFLVPSDISVAQFMWIIRKRIQLPPERALFLFVGKVLPTSSASMGSIFEEHKDEDGFLYVAYSGENTFG